MNRANQAVEAERCRRSAHYLLFESGYVVTKDEHDMVTPVKRVPDIPYLRAMLDCLLVSGRVLPAAEARFAQDAGIARDVLEAMARAGILFLEKSRDVFATNLTLGYCLWRARAFPHQLILVQSKREEDAASLVFVKEPTIARLSFMEDHVPAWLRLTTWPRSGAYGRLYFTNGSQIWAIPEGGDIIRTNHPSVIFADEAAFQPEFGASYTAALPAIKGGGHYVAVSSANPGEFASLVGAMERAA